MTRHVRPILLHFCHCCEGKIYPHNSIILEIQYNDHIIFEMIEKPFYVRNFISYNSRLK